MSIIVTIDLAINHLVPLCEGGYQLPEELRSLEPCESIDNGVDETTLHCDQRIGIDGGLEDGNYIPNSIIINY